MSINKIPFLAFPLLLQFVVPVSGQTALTELARQERAQRSSVQQRVRFFTNRDLSCLKRGRVSTGSGKMAGEKDSLGAEEGGRDVDRRNETGWAARLSETKQRLSVAVNRLHVLQLRHNHLRNLYLNAADELQRMRLERSLEQVLGELRKAESQEEEARSSWLEIQKAAVRAGERPENEPSKAAFIQE